MVAATGFQCTGEVVNQSGGYQLRVIGVVNGEYLGRLKQVG